METSKAMGVVEAALRAVASGDEDRARERLVGIEATLPKSTPRRALTKREQMAIFQRDGFRCRYCERPGDRGGRLNARRVPRRVDDS